MTGKVASKATDISVKEEDCYVTPMTHLTVTYNYKLPLITAKLTVYTVAKATGFVRKKKIIQLNTHLTVKCQFKLGNNNR